MKKRKDDAIAEPGLSAQHQRMGFTNILPGRGLLFELDARNSWFCIRQTIVNIRFSLCNQPDDQFTSAPFPQCLFFSNSSLHSKWEGCDGRNRSVTARRPGARTSWAVDQTWDPGQGSVLCMVVTVSTLTMTLGLMQYWRSISYYPTKNSKTTFKFLFLPHLLCFRQIRTCLDKGPSLLQCLPWNITDIVYIFVEFSHSLGQFIENIRLLDRKFSIPSFTYLSPHNCQVFSSLSI